MNILKWLGNKQEIEAMKREGVREFRDFCEDRGYRNTIELVDDYFERQDKANEKIHSHN